MATNLSESKQIQVNPETDPILTEMNEHVFSVLGNEKLILFQKAWAVSAAIGHLKTLLTPQYMAPIMQLQGNRLGFKTDKDKDGGYPEAVVKNCLIEAVLMGVQPYGNQFNIIGGNTYITKEGFGHLLAKVPGLEYKLIPQLPRVKENSDSGAVVVEVEWTLNGEAKKQNIDFPIRVNKYMGVDGILGKATRKARAWLFNTINGTEIGDGDVQDAEVIHTKVNAPDKTEFANQKELERIEKFINNAKTVESLDSIFEKIPDSLMDLYLEKKASLTPKQ